MDPLVFRSTDPGAPSLSGQAGKLLDVFDFCLVTGLGWTRPFTGTNRACYRAPAGVRDYLDVDDNGPDATQTFKTARVSGFETMSAVGVGTQEFPSSAQSSIKLAIGKAPALNSTDRPWILIGDDRTFYIFINGSGNVTYSSCYSFGEIYSHKASDTDRTIISTGIQGNSPGGGQGPLVCYGITGITETGGVAGQMKRSYLGSGTPCWVISLSNSHSAGNNVEVMKGYMKYPDTIWGGFFLNKVLVCERGTSTSPQAMTAIRGRYRGLYQMNMPETSFVQEDIYAGTGTLAGKTFILLTTLSGTCAIQLEEWEYNS